jgi:hypothetical protein
MEFQRGQQDRKRKRQLSRLVRQERRDRRADRRDARAAQDEPADSPRQQAGSEDDADGS